MYTYPTLVVLDIQQLFYKGLVSNTSTSSGSNERANSAKLCRYLNLDAVIVSQEGFGNQILT